MKTGEKKSGKKSGKNLESKENILCRMNRELSWLKFNERVLNEAGNPRVPLAERLTFASIYQSNLDEFYRVRVGTLMDQMESSEVVRENKTHMTSKEQVKAILKATRGLDKKSVVGRFLEHSRIYRFGTKDREKVYIASADFMTRNTIRRVEVAAPILDERIKEHLDWMFETIMRDDEKGKCLTEKGIYVDQILNKEKLNSQELFYEMAYRNAEKQMTSV